MQFGQSFALGSPAHWGALALIVGLSLVVTRLGSTAQRRGLPARRKIDAGLAIGLLAIWLAVQCRYLLPDRLRWDWSLPLQVCNVVALFAPVAIWNQARYFRAILYHVGLGLCPVALVAPVLHAGFLRPDYWIFWSYHGGIIVAAVYDLTVRCYRPCWRDWAWTAVTLVVFAVGVFFVDIAVNGDYAFIGNNPHAAAFVRVFGPWPVRVIWIVAAGLLTTFVLSGIGQWHARGAGRASAVDHSQAPTRALPLYPAQFPSAGLRGAA